MRSSPTATKSSDRTDGDALAPRFLWSLDEALAARAMQEIRPPAGLLRPMPPQQNWEAALAAPGTGVMIVAGHENELPWDEVTVLLEMRARCILVLSECGDHDWRRLVGRGFAEVLTPPFKGVDLELLLADRVFPLPLDRHLADFDSRVRSHSEARIPADLRYMAPAVGFICRLAREHGFHPRVWLENLPLALDEAISNAIRHGCGQDPARTVAVEVSFSHDVMKVRVEDDGPGFNPESLIDPASEEGLHRGGGRGVMLMRALMDRVEFKDGGRVALLYARRSGTPG
jgi:anti-sigma regulatory factor (Ser/Thr protein kinase)